jgi:hypothetical protein
MGINTLTATISEWSDFGMDEPEPIDCLSEVDVQTHFDFRETEFFSFNGTKYIVTNDGVSLAESIVEYVDGGPKPAGWVSYKVEYAVKAPYATYIMDDTELTVPEPTPRRKHLRLSPHAKLTREILRRPNAKGR